MGLGRRVPVEPDEDLLEHAPEIRLGDALRVPAIDLPTFIPLEEEAGRPEDRAALPVLRAALDGSIPPTG